MKSRLPVFIVFVISGCIGTDFLEDPIVGERIEIAPTSAVLQPEQSIQLTANYYDKYGIARGVIVSWLSTDTKVLMVDETGLVTAVGGGQATVVASYQTATSEAVNINVVTDENAVATVEISTPRFALNVGEKINLTAVIRNINGSVLTERMLEWFSENTSIVAINDEGEVTAISNGTAAVHAKSEGVKSNSIDLVVGSARFGTFVPAGGYNAEGMAIIRQNNGDLTLEFSESFKTSFALGTYVYLSNTTSGSGTFSNGVEIAQISNNGAKLFNISAINPTIGLFDYRYVVILCKPARVTFGYADLD